MKKAGAALCLLALATWAGAEEPPPVVLPDASETVVVRLEYEGGYRVLRPDGAPRLAVLADGTVRAAVGHGTLTTTWDRPALLALLRFVVEKHRLFEFDREAALEAVREQAGPEVPIVEDAPDTVIEVTLGDRNKRASFHALAWMAQQFPKVSALQDLRAIERRLENVVQVVHAGGKEKVAPFLSAANARLQEEEPAPPPLAITDLARTHHWPGGGMDLLFERVAHSGTLRVRVDAPPSKPLTVSIERRPRDTR